MSKHSNTSAKLAAKINHGGYGMQIESYNHFENTDENFESTYESLTEEEVKKIREYNRIVLEKRAEEKRIKKAEKKATKEKRKKERQREAVRVQKENAELLKISKEFGRIAYWQTRYSRGDLDCGWQCSYCGEEFSAESDFLVHLRNEEFVSLVAQSNNYYCPLYRCGHVSRGFSFSDKILNIRNLGDMTVFGTCRRPPKPGKKDFIVEKHSIKTLTFNEKDPVTHILLLFRLLFDSF